MPEWIPWWWTGIGAVDKPQIHLWYHPARKFGSAPNLYAHIIARLVRVALVYPKRSQRLGETTIGCCTMAGGPHAWQSFLTRSTSSIRWASMNPPTFLHSSIWSLIILACLKAWACKKVRIDAFLSKHPLQASAFSNLPSSIEDYGMAKQAKPYLLACQSTWKQDLIPKSRSSDKKALVSIGQVQVPCPPPYTCCQDPSSEALCLQQAFFGLGLCASQDAWQQPVVWSDVTFTIHPKVVNTFSTIWMQEILQWAS